MFGISWAEFLVIVLVAVLIIPSRQWPDVARFLARVVTWVRRVMWRITDASEQIRNQIDLERPIDDLIKSTTDDLLGDFSSPRAPQKKTKKSRGTK